MVNFAIKQLLREPNKFVSCNTAAWYFSDSDYCSITHYAVLVDENVGRRSTFNHFMLCVVYCSTSTLNRTYYVKVNCRNSNIRKIQMSSLYRYTADIKCLRWNFTLEFWNRFCLAPYERGSRSEKNSRTEIRYCHKRRNMKGVSNIDYKVELRRIPGVNWWACALTNDQLRISQLVAVSLRLSDVWSYAICWAVGTQRVSQRPVTITISSNGLIISHHAAIIQPAAGSVETKTIISVFPSALQQIL